MKSSYKEHCLPARCLLLLASLLTAPLKVSTIDVMIPHDHDYTVMEGETLTMTCQVGCADLSRLQYEWKLQIPHHIRSIVPLNKLTDTSFIPKDLFSNFNADTFNTVNCSNTSKHHFYLKLYDVKVALNNSIVKCGVTYKSITTFASAGKFIFVARPAPVDPGVKTTSMTNYATHSGIKITCQHRCHLNTSNIRYLWMIRSLALQRVELNDIDKKREVEEKLRVQISLISGDGNCDAHNMTDFYLDIVGMSDLLQHAVISCGVRVDRNSPEVYSSTDSYIIINETKVDMNGLVHKTDKSGVSIQCTHSCQKGAEFQHLWKVRAFGYKHLTPLYLHDNEVKIAMEKDLGVNISMTSDDDCPDDSMKSLYLHIFGMNTSLQHAIVSCGVMIQNSSSEVYNTHDGYILIPEDIMPTTEAPTTPTAMRPATTMSDPPRVLSKASTLASTAAGLLIFGFVSGILFSVMVCFFKKKIHGSHSNVREDVTDSSDLSREEHTYPNKGYFEVPIKSPTTPAEFKLSIQQ